MKRILLFAITLVFLVSCDDGDIIVTSFDFSDVNIELCRTGSANDTITFNYVFFKNNSETNESLALRLNTSQPILTGLTGGTPYSFTLGVNNKLVYRRFDGAPTSSYFCNPIPPASPVSIEEYVANDGQVTVATLGTLVDADEIPTDEELTLGPDNLEDYDGDGIPNYYDFDDDGDNVPTASEGVEFLEDGTIDYENSRDTDGDGLPDFIDMDDDGDGILTRNEDKDRDLNPNNDVTDESAGPDYLNSAVAVDYEVNEYRAHPYQITDVGLTINLTGVVFENQNADEIIRQESLFFGEYDASVVNTTVKPAFEE